MRPKHTFLRTHVARRVLALFAACALLPIGTLAVISYGYVTRQLESQSRERVEMASRQAGMAILERLLSLEMELAFIGSNLLHQPPTMITGSTALTPSATSGRFRAVGVERPRGHWVGLAGNMPQPPVLADGAERHLAEGKFLLATEAQPLEPAVLIGRAVDPHAPSRGLVWAKVDSRSLWQAGGETSAQSQETMCVFTRSQRSLYCTRPVGAAILEHLGSKLAASSQTRPSSGKDRVFEWRDDSTDDEHIAAYWPVFLNARFLMEDWVVVVSESKAGVLAPMASFKTTFSLVVLLALWVVLLVSNVQIRRTLDPLVELHEGTQRIALGDFNTTVQVSSGDEFEGLAHSFNQMTRRLRRQFNTLTAINEIDRAVLSALDTETIVETVRARSHDVLACDGLSIALAPPGGSGTWRVIAVDSDGREERVRHLRLTSNDMRELKDHPNHFVTEVSRGRRSYLDLALFTTRGIGSFLIFPLLVREHLVGVIALGFREAPAHDAEELAGARQLADQVAVALSNARLLEQLDQLSWGAITALARTIDAKSPWTAGHSERVTKLAVATGVEFGLSDEELEILHRGGLLHDIGKIGVPAEILDKPAQLTEDERRMMQDHVVVGARILAPIAAYAPMIPIVLQHHERVDGSGYPDGLEGEEIDKLARVLAVADVFDAITSPRPYRARVPYAAAIKIIRAGSGTHFDPRAVEAFADAMKHGRPPWEDHPTVVPQRLYA